MHVEPGYSLNQPPAHWGTSNIPASWNDAIMAWCWGDNHLKSSQCGQSELIAYLWRKSSISKKPGYIDIGANDGITRSSTSLLASLGWQGILVEPNPVLACQLRTNRVSDIVLNCACADQFGITTLATCEHISGLGTLSSVADPRATERLNQETSRSGKAVVRFPCVMVPASQIYSYAHRLIGAIGFLKVDAEGCEQIILADIFRVISPADLPGFVEVENNYRDQACSDILKQSFTLLCVMDSFVEIYVRNDLAYACRPFAIEFFKKLTVLNNI